MIALAKSSSNSLQAVPTGRNVGWQDRFECLLPAICRHARRCFRNLSAQARMEAVQETVASAFVAYARLVKLGKEELAYATPLAQFAVRRVRAGRMVGAPVNVNDVTSRWCQRRRGICVESLDQQDGRPGWREIVVEDRQAGPADIAATKIDFEDWLCKLPLRQRAIAEVLATGEETGTVARRFGLTAGRVSQLRRKLHRSWCLLQGETHGKSASELAD